MKCEHCSTFICWYEDEYQDFGGRPYCQECADEIVYDAIGNIFFLFDFLTFERVKVAA